MNPPLSGDWITHGMKFLEIKAVGSMEEKKKKVCGGEYQVSTEGNTQHFAQGYVS